MIKRIKRMFFNPNKVDPLKNEIDWAVDGIINKLCYVNKSRHKEVLAAVIKRELPGYGIKAHPYVKNPKRKEKVVDAITEPAA
jgi:hypothetical protein